MEKRIKQFSKKLINTQLKRRIAKYAFWSIFGAGISKVFYLITLMITARILGKEYYGQFGIINSTILMFVTVAAVGMGATASKFIAEYRHKDFEKMFDIYLITNLFSLIIGILFTVLLFCFAPIIAKLSFNNVLLTNYLRIASLIFFLNILNGAQNGVLAGFEKFKEIAISNVALSIFQSISFTLGAYYFGLKGVFLAVVISQFFLNFYNYILIRKELKKYDVSIVDRLKQLTLKKIALIWEFSLPTAISSLTMIPIIWWAKTELIKHSGFGASANFDVAEQWRSQILYIPSLLAQIVLPILSSSFGDRKKNDFLSTIKINLILNVSITTILALLVCLLTPLILMGYGKGFLNVIPVYILAITAILISASNIIFPILMTYNKMWSGVLINFVWGIIFIFLTNYFLVNNYGENGLAYAMLISYCISIFIQVLYANSIIKRNVL